MNIKIYIKGELYPHVLYPLTYLGLVITNTHRRVISRIELCEADGEVQSTIGCRGLPERFDRIFFHRDWTPEAFVEEDGAYLYDRKQDIWVKRKEQHADAAS